MSEVKVLELAKQANVSIRGYYDDTGSTPAELQRFAELVRNAAIEEAAVKCEEIDFSYSACEQFVSGEAAFECGKQIRSLKS